MSVQYLRVSGPTADRVAYCVVHQMVSRAVFRPIFHFFDSASGDRVWCRSFVTACIPTVGDLVSESGWQSGGFECVAYISTLLAMSS